MKQIFWDVDTQVDFLDSQGKLYVPGSEAILPNLARLTRWAADHGVLVVASACAHHPDDAEFREWPPHCLVGTEGQRKVPETVLERALVVPNRAVEIPADLGAYQQVLIEKQELNVFTNPNTARLVEQLGRPEIVLYGVVTELCVAQAAGELQRRGCQVRLVQDAVYALDSAKAQACVKELVARGGSLTTTAEVLGRETSPGSDGA